MGAKKRYKAAAGLVDRDKLYGLEEAVDIIVIGNGDVRTPLDARRMLDETGCDAVMVGRAALGNPDIFRQMHHYLETGELVDEPTIAERIETAKQHARLMVEEYGEERGMKMMRRYLGWYVKGFPGAATLRPRLFKVERLTDVDEVLGGLLK